MFKHHLLTGMELSPETINHILKTAGLLKQQPQQYADSLRGKCLALIFEKPSLRTRLSFMRAIQTLGGTCVESVSQTRKNEAPKDLIRVLNGYVDFVMVRTHDESMLTEMADYSDIPIINGLSALHHPCQILADLLTLQENFGDLHGLTLTYIGDGNNILQSLLLLAPKVGINIHYCCPPQHQPNAAILQQALSTSTIHSGVITRYLTPEEAVHNANAVYTDVWTSMGFENQVNEAHFAPYQVNEALLAQAHPNARFMHCMPMERGKEVSDTLPDSPVSVIFEQSENRLHVQKAILLYLQRTHELESIDDKD
jgi:ornithine carbamoyltransferase